MSAVTKEYFPSLLHLISLGVVGAATVGVFFGVGLMWLTDPQPAAPPADEVRPAQALEFPEVHQRTTTGRGIGRWSQLPTMWQRSPHPTPCRRQTPPPRQRHPTEPHSR